jgi:hypothetical protein
MINLLEPPPSLESPQRKRAAMKKFVVTLQIFFSHQSLIFYFFATPPTKSQTGIANTWGTTNNKPFGPIIMMGHSKH